MAEDNYSPKGQNKRSKPDAGGGVLRDLPVIGIVKNNIDNTRAGRIDVYIEDFGGPDPNDQLNWTTVNYMSPFFGSTPASGTSDNYGTYISNPSSYGMWFSPPDIGSKVVCVFINGDSNYGYYIGGILEPELLQMIPAIGASDNIVANKGEAEQTGGAPKLPVTNLNTNNKSITDSQNFLNEAKTIHSYAAGIYQQQGLLRDPIRGPISSSALRESPSRVGWGVSTPGRPIFQGGYTDQDVLDKGSQADTESLQVIGRRGGHSIVLDDGDINGKDQLIRLRTIQGHQILMSDDGQTLQIIHSNGQSYVELGTEGTVDIYAMNSVNVRTQGDLNLHADNNININAKKDLNIAAENINMNAATNIGWRAGSNFNGYALGTYTIKVNGSMSMFGSGEGSYASGGTMFVNGSKINLNTGSTSVTPAEVPLITQIAHTDTLNDPKVGFAAAPALLKSIVSRAPAHMPWANAGQGVDVSVTSSPADSLPAQESSAVETANQTTATKPEVTTNSALTSTVPPVPAVSESLDTNVSSAMVSAAAVAASEVAPEVVASGTGVVADATGEVNAAVGKMAMTPQQMEAAMVIKPGSAALATSLVQGGANVATAMPASIFTGKPGAENLDAFVENTGAQVVAKAATLQQAQTALTTAGVITGKEAPGAIAGLVNAAATVGVAPTVDFIKNAAGVTTAGSVASALGSSGLGALADSAKGVLPNITLPSAPGGLADSLNGAGSNIASAIASGNFASNLSTNAGGLSSISTSLAGLGPEAKGGGAGAVASAKSLTASAFGAITKSFKPLQANVPQNLTAIAAKNSEDQAVAEEVAALPASQVAALKTMPGTNAVTSSLNSAKTAASGMSPQTSALLMSTITALASGGKNSVISGGTASLLKQGIGISQTLTSGKNLSQGQIGSTISAIGAATGGTSTGARQSASLIAASIGIGQSLSSGKNLSANQIGTIVGGLNSSQGKNGIPNSLITQGIGLAQTLASNKSITQGQINGLVGSVAQIGTANGGKRINSATTALIAQSIGLTATVSAGKKVTPGQVSALVTSSINAAISAGSPTNRRNGGGSGVGALPGGLSAIAAVTIGAVATGTPVNVKTIGNMAVNSVSSIPGLAPWGAVIRNASAVAMNNISKPTAAASTVASLSAGTLRRTVNSDVSSISPESTAITQNIEKTKKVPLSALATSGLSPSAAASLTASVNAMNSGGSSPVKLPTVSTGTVDRSQLTSQINSMLGSNKIQVPNFSGVPPTPNNINTDSTALAEQDAVIKEIASLKDKRWDVSKAAGNAKYRASEAKQRLPQGDPQIETFNIASVSAQKDLEDLDKKIVELQRKQYTLVTGEPAPDLQA